MDVTVGHPELKRFGFTGTRSFDKDLHSHVKIVDQIILDLVQHSELGEVEFTTGACVGFDAYMAFRLLSVFKDSKHRLVVPADRKQVDKGIVLTFERFNTMDTEVVYMPEGTTYRD